MATDVTSIGVAVETSGVERGIRSLKELAQQGPAVEKSMQGVERAASGADKALSGVGGGASDGIKKVSKSADEAKRSMDGMASSAGKVGDSFKGGQVTTGLNDIKTSASGAAGAVGSLNSLLATVGIGISVKSVIDLADGYTKFSAQLQLATKSAGEYSAAMSSVRKIAADAQQGLGEVGTLYARIANGTAELGLSQQQLASITETVALGLKVSGATAAESSSAMLQLSQAFASGTLRGEEFNAVNEAAPRLMKALADGMGVPIGKLREMSSEGKITSQVLAEALPKALADIRKEAATIQTIGGSFTKLKNSMMEFVGQADRASGATKIISEGVGLLAKNLDVAAVTIGAIALVIGGRYVGAMVASSAATAQATAENIRYQATLASMAGVSTAAAAGIGTVSVAARAASAALGLMGGPIGLLITALGAGAAAFLYFRDTSQEAVKAIGGLDQPLDDLKKKIDALPPEKKISILIDVEKSGKQAIKDADSDVQELTNSVKQWTRLKLPTDQVEGLTKSLTDASKSGADMTPILQQAARAGDVSPALLQKWLQLAANIRTAKTEAANAAGVIAAAAGSSVGGGRGTINPPTIAQISKRANAEAETVLKDTKSYRSKSEALAEVRAEGKKVSDALKALTDAGDGSSEMANKLRERLTGVDEKLASMTKTSGGASSGLKSAENAYSTLSKKITDYIKQMEIEATQGDKLTKSQQLQIELDDLLATSKGKVSAAKVAGLQADIQAAALLEKTAAAAKLEAQQADEAAKAYESVLEAAEKRTDSLRKQIDSEKDAAAAIGLSKEAIAELEVAKLQEMAATAERKALLMDEIDLSGQQSTALRAEAQALRDLASAKYQRAIKEANYDTAKQAEKDWEQVSQTIGRTLSDYIMGGGKDAATYLKRLFSTLVLQPVVETAVGSLMGNQSAGKSGLSSLTDWTKLGNAAGDFLSDAGFNAISKGWTQTGESLFNLGQTVTSFDNTLKSIPGFSGGLGSAAGYLGSIYSLSQGQYGSALGSAIGTAIAPGIGTIIGSTLGSLLDGFGHSSTQEYGGTGYYSAATGAQQSTSRDAFGTGFTKVAGNDQILSQMAGLSQSIVQSLDATAKTFGQTVGYEVATSFASDFGDEATWGGLKIALQGSNVVNWNDTRQTRWAPKEFSSGDAGYQEYLTAVAADVKAAFLAMDLPVWADQLLEAASGLDGINSALQQISTIKSVFDGLGQTMSSFTNLSGSVQTILMNVSGGIDALASNAQSYYQNFYSEQERLDATVNSLATTFAKYGAELPTTTEQYRALVEQQLAAGDAGAEFAAVLLGLNGTFKTVSDEWEKELESMAHSISDTFAGIKDDIAQALADVAASRKDIIRGSGVMTEDEIRAAIGQTALSAPALAGVYAAQSRTASATQSVAAAQSAADASRGGSAEQKAAVNAAQIALDAALNDRAGLQSQLTEPNKFLDRFKNYDIVPGQFVDQYLAEKAKVESLNQQIAGMGPTIDALRESLAYQQSQLNQVGTDEAQKLAQAQANLKAAQEAEIKAKADYAAQMRKFVTDAGNSVSKLSDLRGEVMDLYEAQVQAVEAMLKSASNLRGIVDTLRLGQLTSAQTVQELGSRYATDYSMALATTGSTRAGYVDAMAGNLQSLTEALKTESATSSEWQIQTAKLFAQASNAAGLLEADAENADFQDVALDLLGSIDDILKSLESSTKTGEQIIADAVTSGNASNLVGLRAVVAAVKGEAVPAFAVGTNYVPRDMLAQIHEGEAIVPKAFNPWAGGGMPASGGVGSKQLESLLAQFMAEQRVQASQQVSLQLQLNKLMQRWDANGMPEIRDVTA